MNNEIVASADKHVLSAIDVRKQVNLIQEVMKNVMQEGTHYGKVPGCGDKPALFKAGAETLSMTFRLSPDYEELPGSVEGDDFILYKINCKLTHIPTGFVVGNGRGTCNSKEKKYRTRSVYANKATDEEKKIGKKETRSGQSGKYEVYIVPQDPWDVQNTLYKMACKRAQVAAILNATAASDIFTQDFEDLPEGTVINEEHTPKTKPAVSMPKEKVTKPAKTTKEEANELAEEMTKDQPESDVVTVEQALEIEEGKVIPLLYGMFQEAKTRQVNSKKKPGTKIDITDYIISTPGNADITLQVSAWGKQHEGVIVSKGVTFVNVTVGSYQGKKQFGAQDIQC